MTAPDVQSPREIVAALHQQIAGQSPEHAALVAAYEAIPRLGERPVRQARPCPVYGSRRYKRMTVYRQARLAGRGTKAAARLAGISRSSGGQYETDFLASLGGGP